VIETLTKEAKAENNSTKNSKSTLETNTTKK